MTDFERLKYIINEIDILIFKNVSSSDPDFEAWHTKTERFLIKYFGNDSFEHKKFKNTLFSLMVWTSETTESDYIAVCIEDLKTTKAVLLTYLEEMEEEENTMLSENSVPFNSTFEKIFIVHGHDGELKQSVARIIEKQGIEAIILSEQANQGRTIIEKIEDYSDVSGAICLFTADDLGRAKNNSDDLPRARQNVVFEAGYFMGKLSRSNVVIIAEKGVEIPSDMQGIVYTDKDNWEFDVLKELKAMGYDINLNKLL